ncbi:F-box/kelch-repeat protein At3g06240 [Lactuca sativa]|nr:F-box/kelch-repeat protein At3g06240 [Lactuca sativa]
MVSPRSRHPTTMENLQGEVLSDIFIRLLAKQLAQMRCVCKDWNALLSESSFVKSHLHRSTHINQKILMFFGVRADCTSFTASPFSSPANELDNFFKFPVNLESQPARCFGNVVGSVKGLICFKYESGDDYIVCIQNHSLSAFLTLPPCSMGSSSESRNTIFRFGYDPKTDDYKVVKLTEFFDPRRMAPVEVYSLRKGKGSWELVSQRIPSHLQCIRDQDLVCVDGHEGHLHWFCYTYIGGKLTQLILAFDLGSERFKEIPFPDSLRTCCFGDRLNVVGVLGGKVCVMSRVRDTDCEVWVMDEYSWVKLHVFSGFSGGDKIFPYGFTSNKQFLFRSMNELNRYGLYDPVIAKTKNFKIRGRSVGCKVVEYFDSLVWINRIIEAKRHQ